MAHEHTISPEEWPFEYPMNTASVGTAKVVRDRFPILAVSHDDDGEWQFLDATTVRPEEPMIVCLGCMFGRDRSLLELVDLPPGWQAQRRNPTEPWEWHPPV